MSIGEVVQKRFVIYQQITLLKSAFGNPRAPLEHCFRDISQNVLGPL